MISFTLVCIFFFFRLLWLCIDLCGYELYRILFPLSRVIFRPVTPDFTKTENQLELLAKLLPTVLIAGNTD